MSESKVTFCFTSYSVNAGSLQLRLNPYPLPLPAARPHALRIKNSKGIACSVCTVDLASCSNVMQCKENFYSLAGLPLDFPERIHLAPSVSQAKDFLYFIVGF